MSIHDFSSSNRPAVPAFRTIFGILLVGAMLIPGSIMAQDEVCPVPLTVMRRAVEAFEGAPFPNGDVVLEVAFPHTRDKSATTLREWDVFARDDLPTNSLKRGS